MSEHIEQATAAPGETRDVRIPSVSQFSSHTNVPIFGPHPRQDAFTPDKWRQPARLPEGGTWLELDVQFSTDFRSYCKEHNLKIVSDMLLGTRSNWERYVAAYVVEA